MPLLDIATVQTSLHSHSSPLRAQSLICYKVFSNPFTFGDEKRLLFVRKSFYFLKKPNACERTKLQIKAVATLEPKTSVKKEKKDKKNAQLEVDSRVSNVEADSSDVDEKEQLRRNRISKANKGNTPWNKGRKHSPETLQKIRERTKLAMQNPKIREKLANLGHSQSEETKSKIAVGVRMKWKKRREKIMVQESCYHEWQNLIAEASRKGYAGEEEMQWDSYETLKQKLEAEWVESIEHRKTMPRPKGSKRAPKSPEQRRRIAEAIAAKWADPDYRERVCSALSKYHGTQVGGERKPRRKPSSQPRKQDPTKRNTDKNNLTKNVAENPVQQFRLRSKAPVYKDPMAKSKLLMIKNIRARRAATETKKTEAIERARLLIADAEKAAEALELAATKSPIARASLVETRKLIAEAVQLLESTDPQAPNEPVGPVDKEIESSNESGMQPEPKEANGAKILASSDDKDLNFTNLSVLKGENGLLPLSSNGYSSPAMQSGFPKDCDQLELNINGTRVVKEESHCKPIAVTKKWVRGRLVEVTTEGDQRQLRNV